jgi:hypothetical protein
LLRNAFPDTLRNCVCSQVAFFDVARPYFIPAFALS